MPRLSDLYNVDASIHDKNTQSCMNVAMIINFVVHHLATSSMNLFINGMSHIKSMLHHYSLLTIALAGVNTIKVRMPYKMCT